LKSTNKLQKSIWYFLFNCLLIILFSSSLKAQKLRLTWANKMGSAATVGYDIGKSIVVDAAGNVYTIGNGDIMIRKLDASGNLIWAKNIGSYVDRVGNSIAVDASGNVYATGTFGGTVDFDPGDGIYNLTGPNDIFIMKLDSSGNFVWAKNMGNNYDYVNEGVSIALDVTGNVYTTGYFGGTIDFDPGAGTNYLTANGTSDIFISKLNNTGDFVWARNMSGPRGEGSSIAVDLLGNVYTTGYFEGTTDFDPGAGTYNLTSTTYDDIFISKLDASGNFVWAKQIGAAASDHGNSITLDLYGHVYTTGSITGTADFDPGPGTYTITTVGGIFVSKLDTAGNFIWAKKMGQPSSDAMSVTTDSLGNVYTTGHFSLTVDLDPGVAKYYASSAGNDDIFISKLDSSGNFVWAGVMGGTLADYGNSVAVAGSNVYVTGSFQGTADFDPGDSIYNITSAGAWDVFAIKLSQAIWNGSHSNDWSDALNWASGMVPGKLSDVVIPPGLLTYPTVSNSTEINSLIVQDGAILNVMPNIKLTISGH
jgi:hypothetical protein